MYDEPRTIRRTVEAEYRFTDQERLELAKQLATKTTEKDQLNDSKKNYVSQMKSEIDGVDAEIKLLSQKITTGAEFREFFCRCEFDYENGVKHWIDDQTGEVRKSEKLSANDWQMRMDLQDDDENVDGTDDDTVEGNPIDDDGNEPDVEPQEQLALPAPAEDAEFTPVSDEENE